MPYSSKQRRFFFADARRAEQGKETMTGMGKEELLKHAHEPMKKAKGKKPMKFRSK